MTCILSFNKWEAREGVISLFVENLPERLHWKGFWFAFARHGDVMSVYIARRRSRGGKRFGFVRMKNSEEADRVIQRLNGATLYGSRLVVKIARDKQGQSWERNTTGKSHSTDYKKIGIGMEDEAVVQKVRTRVSTEVDIVGVKEIGFNDGTSYPLCNQWKKEEKSCEKLDESDEKLTAFHENGVEESIKKDSTLDLVEKVTAGNYVGIQRVFSVENAGQVNTKAVGPDNGPIFAFAFGVGIGKTLKILIWNIRGISSEAKFLVLRQVIRIHKVDFAALQETKKLKVVGKDVREFWGDDVFGFCFSEAVRKAGGLLVVRNINSLQIAILLFYHCLKRCLRGLARRAFEVDWIGFCWMLFLETTSGLCLLNFTAAQSLRSITSIDCWTAFAPLLVNVICCPQQHATLVILVGQSSNETGVLALNRTFAEPCLSDIEQVLTGQGAGFLPSRLVFLLDANYDEQTEAIDLNWSLHRICCGSSPRCIFDGYGDALTILVRS
ncbi:hypothetical protein V6N11_063660 [Hibiscus sabdariffa]|uniref:RRM domain-containing protein n=1 Tax=Hibiscus sabdariffa TaxID=183260 RepID=A0ABR2PLM3_9ROSI